MMPEMAHLRSVAEAAMTGRSWEWSGVGEHGYPQQIISQGDAVLIAEVYESPDFPSSLAEFIATFDPPTGLALLAHVAELEAALAAAEARLRAVEALADEWHRIGRDGLPHLGCLDMYRHCARELRRTALTPPQPAP